MTNTNILRLVACLAWAGVAVSSAAPVQAEAITTQVAEVGSFAACASAYTSQINHHCGSAAEGEIFYQASTAYTQRIKFVTTPCNSGGCNPENIVVYVGSVYATGRKTVTGAGWLCMSKYSYGLGSCAC
jgi:hypothetical protein